MTFFWAILLFLAHNVCAGTYYCWAYGDPHYKTFKGRRFDFQNGGGGHLFFEAGSFKVYTSHHRFRNVAPNTAIHVQRYGKDIGRIKCPERGCHFEILNAAEIKVDDISGNPGAHFDTRQAPWHPQLMVQLEKLKGFGLFIKRHNKCGPNNWCSHGWMDIGIRWKGDFRRVSNGLCRNYPGHVKVPKLPKCERLDICCGKYHSIKGLKDSCKVDASFKCCEDSKEFTCCDEFQTHCGAQNIAGGTPCSAGQRCEQESGECVKIKNKIHKLKSGKVFNDDMKDWSHSTTTHCGKFGKVIGGYNKFGVGAMLEKWWSLPCTQFTVKLDFTFVRIDSWDHEEAYLKVNGKERWRKQGLHSHGEQVCGGGSKDEEWKVNLEFVLEAQNKQLDLLWGTTVNQAPNDESWGLKDVKVRINCHKRATPNMKGKKFGSAMNKGRCSTTTSTGYPGDMGKIIDMKKHDMKNIDDCIKHACMPFDECAWASCCGPKPHNQCIAYTTNQCNVGNLHQKNDWGTTALYFVETPTGTEGAKKENEEEEVDVGEMEGFLFSEGSFQAFSMVDDEEETEGQQPSIHDILSKPVEPTKTDEMAVAESVAVVPQHFSPVWTHLLWLGGTVTVVFTTLCVCRPRPKPEAEEHLLT